MKNLERGHKNILESILKILNFVYEDSIFKRYKKGPNLSHSLKQSHIFKNIYYIPKDIEELIKNIPNSLLQKKF